MSSSDVLARETPPWFDEAKLGIFIHWCPATIPAWAPLLRIADLFGLPTGPDGVVEALRLMPHAAMYENTMLIPDSPTARYHAEVYGDFPYQAFGEQFRTQMIPGWDPEPWAELARASGARYVVLTTKLPDGFLLWPSEHRNPRRDGWQSDRDVVGELAAAVRARGLRFGTYYCGGMDGSFSQGPVTDLISTNEVMGREDDYIPYLNAHWRELIDRYEPCVIWNDFSFPPQGDPEALFRYYLERVPDGVINNRFQPTVNIFEPDPIYSDFLTPEYSTAGTPELKWETCRGIGLSFGFNRQESEATYTSSTDLIHLFTDIVSRGGNLLLNLSPTATGEIPWGEAQRVTALGWWLSTNGEAIYATRPWHRSAGITDEGLGVRYTATDQAVHAIVLGTPRTAEVGIDVRLDDGAQVCILGRPLPLQWRNTLTGVRVKLPEVPHERPTLTLRMSPTRAVHDV